MELFNCRLLSLLLVIYAFTATTYGDVDYTCHANNVLAVSKQNDTLIGMNQLHPSICGEERVCIYTPGPCVAKGSYLAGLRDQNGKLEQYCCQYSPPVNDHSGDNCQEVVIKADNFGVSTPAKSIMAAAAAAKSRVVNVVTLDSIPPAVDASHLVKTITPLTSNEHDGFTVTICSPQCGSTTTSTTGKPSTSTPPKNKEEKKQEHPKKGIFGGDHKCFSADMTVMTPSGHRTMAEVKVGDKVLVASDGLHPVFEPIEWLYHRDPSVQARFVTVTTRSNRVIQLSPNHLIPHVPCTDGILSAADLDSLAASQSVFARRLRPGSCIASYNQTHFVSDQIVKVTMAEKTGIFSPITTRGTIVVNGVYASCFSSVEHHQVQAAVHQKIIKFRKLITKLLMSEDSTDAGIPLSIKAFLSMAQLVMPSYVY